MTSTEEISTKLRPYLAYRDSGLEWVGEIPLGWEVARFRHVLRRKRQVTNHKLPDLTLLSVSEKNGVVPREEILKEGQAISRAEEFDGYKICAKDDLVMNIMLAWKGAYGIARETGMVSPAYEVFVLDQQRVHPEFLEFLLSTKAAQTYFEQHSTGIVASRLRLYAEEFVKLQLVLPPFFEQQAIGAFLARETARIDELLREQGLLLEELALRRTATINDATQALLGTQSALLPTGWQVVPLKSLMVSMEQGWSPQCENRPAGEGEWGVLKVGCVNGHRFNPEENKALPDDLEPMPRYALRRDDVLVSRANTRDLVGSAARVEQDYPQLLLCDKLYRLRPDHSRLLPDYLVFLLGSPLARAAIEMAASGASASMVNISQGTVKNLMVPLPPLETQRTILTHLDAQLAQIDALTGEVRASMTLMRQHRAALITAAVTGKIDVRNHA